MKELFITFVTAVLLSGAASFSPYAASAAQPPEVSAKAAVVISADTGEIVYSVNCNEKLPMASTTKIMTTLLCLESGDLDEEFTVDSEAIKVEGSSMGLQEGDIVTKYALCCGMLLPSGNDAANAAAVRISGSIEAFAELMNDRARELGLSHTYFVTPSGLEGEGHGSSAYDMALLAREALKNETFREICSSETIKLSFGNPPYERWLKNTNKLLSMYDGVYGVKTGFTDEAGRCLVSACERGGEDLICVTLNDRNDWNDHISMYDYGFEAVRLIQPELPADMSVDVVGGETESAALTVGDGDLSVTAFAADSSDLQCTVISSPFVYAPVSQGDELAQLEISLNGREICRVPLYAAESVPVKVHEAAEPQKEKSIFNKFITKLGSLFS